MEIYRPNRLSSKFPPTRPYRSVIVHSGGLVVLFRKFTEQCDSAAAEWLGRLPMRCALSAPSLERGTRQRCRNEHSQHRLFRQLSRADTFATAVRSARSKLDPPIYDRAVSSEPHRPCSTAHQRRFESTSSPLRNARSRARPSRNAYQRGIASCITARRRTRTRLANRVPWRPRVWAHLALRRSHPDLALRVSRLSRYLLLSLRCSDPLRRRLRSALHRSHRCSDLRHKHQRSAQRPSRPHSELRHKHLHSALRHNNRLHLAQRHSRPRSAQRRSLRHLGLHRRPAALARHRSHPCSEQRRSQVCSARVLAQRRRNRHCSGPAQQHLLGNLRRLAAALQQPRRDLRSAPRPERCFRKDRCLEEREQLPRQQRHRGYSDRLPLLVSAPRSRLSKAASLGASVRPRRKPEHS